MPAPLLYLPFKIPVRYDLVQPLADWLDDDESQTAFGGSSASSDDSPPSFMLPKPTYNSVQCRSELLRVAALRNCISEALMDSHQSALEEHQMLRDCQDYHATLLEFEKRGFPTGSADDENGIDLTWKGAFCESELETHHTLLWDRACTLWNLAALLSAEAAIKSDETTKEGLKLAIRNLQQAASHLSLCRQLLDFSQENDSISTVDLSKPMLQFWEKLLLAQAQTRIYKLANLGGSSVRNHTTLAYLVQGAAPLYNEALKLAKDNRLQSEVPDQCQEWAAHCKAKSLLCQARAYFHMSIEHRISKSAHGPELARLKQTTTTLDEVLRFCQTTQALREASEGKRKMKRHTKDGRPTPIAEAASTIQPEAEGLKKLAMDRYRAAEADNRSVYLEDVPSVSELPEIRSQTMVKTDLPLPEDMLMPRASLFAWE